MSDHEHVFMPAHDCCTRCGLSLWTEYVRTKHALAASEAKETGFREALQEVAEWAFYDEVSHEEMQEIARSALSKAGAG